ncbi:MAG: hypothetical protein ILNGONEN_00444 [Syntrophorhabdaceae bacterium]|nr:hypothetical protein [Syntrophorhabdaceae bacterium]
MIAQIFALQAFHLLVFFHLQIKSTLHDLVGQDGEFHTAPRAAIFPFVSQILPNRDAAQTLIDPLFGIAFLFIQLLHARHGQFGIFDFVDPLLADARQPAFERLGLGRGDGLDQAQDALGVPALEFLRPSGRRKLQGKGGDKLSPPLKSLAQIRIPFAHLLPVIGRIWGIRQGSNDVRNDKPPFVVVKRAADFALLEHRHARFRIIIVFIHKCDLHHISSFSKKL